MTLVHGDCLTVLPTLDAESFDACVTDPPYGFGDGKAAGFMGKEWDRDVPGSLLWREVYRVLKPGAHLLSFFGTRTYHRGVVAIEDAGFEIRDQIGWLYGSGFPKSHNISKAIDKAAGAERKQTQTFPMAKPSNVGAISKNLRCSECGLPRQSANPCRCPRDSGPATEAAKQWDGWGTALKPAWEPIVVARKPFKGTVASNVLEHRTGALNIEAGRVLTDDNLNGGAYVKKGNRAFLPGDTRGSVGAGMFASGKTMGVAFAQSVGRWPANVVHDGSDEVLAEFAKYGESGESPARFFYSAKVSKKERGDGNKHPTVKPIALMEYLVRLVTPEGGRVLDPFVGSGTTALAAKRHGFSWLGIEWEQEYFDTAQRRIEGER